MRVRGTAWVVCSVLVAGLGFAASAQAAFTSTLSGSTATMTSSGSASDTIIVRPDSGLLRHNRFASHDPDFNSDFDWDTTTAGDQTLAAATGSHVNINAGDGNDTLIAGAPGAPASAIRGPVSFDGQVGTDELRISDRSAPAGLQPDILAAEVALDPGTSLPITHANIESRTIALSLAGSHAHIIEVPAGLPTTVTGGPADDSFVVGSGGGMIGILGPLTVGGSDGSDTLTFSDFAPNQARTYQLGTQTLDRVGFASPVTFTGFEDPLLEAGGADDAVFKQGSTPFEIQAGDGNDLVVTRDLVGDTVDCGGATDVVTADLHDTLNANCEDQRTAAAPQEPAPPAQVVTNTITVPGPAADSGVGAPTALPADTQPPSIVLAGLPRKPTSKQLVKGVTFTVTPSEASALDVEERASTKRATIARAFDLTLAHQSLPLGAGARTVKLKASRRLVARAKRFSVRISVTATDAAGNRATASRTLKVR